MANWQVALDLKEQKGGAEQPIFIRLARAISDDVRRGRLKPGDALPGSRSLARALGVHRNTVRRRLRRVEDLTGRSPATPRGRAELWVAAEIARRYS